MTMRIASWMLVLCCALASIGVFFPAIEARPALAEKLGHRISRHSTLSLYQAASDRQLARRLLAVYRASHGTAVGTRLLGAIDPVARGRLKDALDDAHDAMDTLGGISDDDAKTIGTAVAVAIWVFLAIQVITALVVLVQAVGGIYRRGRVVGVLVLSVIGAAMAIAMWIACKQVVFEINDELSSSITELGSGAWMILVGGVGALIGGIALLIAHLRDSRR
jgi:hypothetical protein